MSQLNKVRFQQFMRQAKGMRLQEVHVNRVDKRKNIRCLRQINGRRKQFQDGSPRPHHIVSVCADYHAILAFRDAGSRLNAPACINRAYPTQAIGRQVRMVTNDRYVNTELSGRIQQ